MIERKTKQARAKQRYICHLCRKPILFGNQYMAETRKDERGYTTLHRHIHCDAMLEAYKRYYSDELYYSERQVTKVLREKLCKYICDEKQRGECGPEDVFACELSQERILSPTVMGAAKESVRENFYTEG